LPPDGGCGCISPGFVETSREQATRSVVCSKNPHGYQDLVVKELICEKIRMNKWIHCQIFSFGSKSLRT
jgi:hypothetical protein